MKKLTWKRWMENTGKLTLAVLLLFPLSFCGHQPALAQDQYTEKQKNQFLAYENKVYDLIEKGLRPLEKLDTVEDNATLTSTIREAEKNFGNASVVFSKLTVLGTLPPDVRRPLNDLNQYFSTGFKSLEQSMGSFLVYLDWNDPAAFDSFSIKLDEGISFIDGGLTSLAAQRMKLFPKILHGKDAWVLAKKRLYELRPR